MKDLYSLYLIRPDNSKVITVVKLYPACSDKDAVHQGGAMLMARKHTSSIRKKWGEELFEYGETFTTVGFGNRTVTPIVVVKKEIDLN